MPRLIALAALLLTLATPTLAGDSPVLAEYRTDSGSLPPEYAWEASVILHEDGSLELKRCTGYETEGPACKTRRAKATPEALKAIRAAALDSGLGKEPALIADEIMVGGGSTYGAVWLDGARIELPSQPGDRDAGRVRAVLAAIRAAIPARLHRFLAD